MQLMLEVVLPVVVCYLLVHLPATWDFIDSSFELLRCSFNALLSLCDVSLQWQKAVEVLHLSHLSWLDEVTSSVAWPEADGGNGRNDQDGVEASM